MWARAVLVGVFLGAVSCASGGASNASDDDSPHDAATQPRDSHVNQVDAAHHDAQEVSTPDAAPDAFIPPDAPPGSVFCDSDQDCTAAQCCFDFGTPPGFCVDGADFLGVCVPSGN